MKWTKRGLIYAPDGKHSWAVHYAFPPTPHFISDDVIRLYVAFCDQSTVGRVGFVDVLASDPSKILNVSEHPALDIGLPGSFDENGVLPTSVIRVENRLYMYYVGYQLGTKVRYFQFQGLAISEDQGESFVRATRVPVIDRSDKELLNRTSAFVRYKEGRFQMWYVGGSEWTEVDGKSLPVYNLRYLESEDGQVWGQDGKVSLDFVNDDEHAFGRPYIVEDSGLQRMFYSIRRRSTGYRLGYAESADGLKWARKDEEIGIDVSASGWDSQMIAYASIVKFRDRVYMFYNGNNCGQTGFGYATLEHW